MVFCVDGPHPRNMNNSERQRWGEGKKQKERRMGIQGQG